MIRYLKHNQIDLQRWDMAIDNARNRLVYAQSWYLDIVSPEWHALVTDDYSGVMPLPAKSKWNIPYLIQPRFTQQLGIFSNQEVTTEVVHSFLKAIPKKFIWYDINLNSANDCVGLKNLIYQDNYELDLNCAYEQIWLGYNMSTRQNVKKAARLGLRVEEELDSSLFLKVYLEGCKVKPDKIGTEQLARIVEFSMKLGIGKIYLVKDTKNNILAGAFYLCQFNRFINLVSFTTNEGRASSAMVLLIDYVIQSNAGQPSVLDFEGSTIPGIAEFFRGFGGKCTNYPRLKGIITK
jgi:hypothetical protein